MSVYYFVACKDCELKTGIVVHSNTQGEVISSEEEMLAFLMNHQNHSIVFFNEHEEEFKDFPTEYDEDTYEGN